MILKGNPSALTWLIIILIVFFKTSWTFAGSDTETALIKMSSKHYNKMITLTKNGIPLGYKLFLFAGSGSVDLNGTRSHTAKLFTNNIYQINTPRFTLQDKFKTKSLDLSFFVPNGFRFANLSSVVATRNLLQQTGAWTILKSDHMQDFNILPFADQELSTLVEHLALLYENTDARPEPDSIIVLRDEAVPHLQLVTLTEIISQLQLHHAHYQSLAVASNRIPIFDAGTHEGSQETVFGESLDFSSESIAYRFGQGFILQPDFDIETSIVTAEPKIQVLRWWQDLREGLRLPETFSYTELKLLYASLAHMRTLKKSFFHEVHYNLYSGPLLLDSELIPKIQPAFLGYIKSLQTLPTPKYQTLIENVKRVIKHEQKLNKLQLIFTHENTLMTARRLAAKDASSTFIFLIRENQFQYIPYSLTSKNDFVSISKEIKDSKKNKSFIFLGSPQDVYPDIRNHNYQQESLAARILQTMTTFYGIYPSTLEFINYFDIAQGEHIPQHFESAVTAISLDPLHQHLWPQFAEINNGKLGVRIIRTDNAQLITPLGTLLNVSERQVNWNLSTELASPPSYEKFLALTAGNRILNPVDNSGQYQLLTTSSRPLIKQLDAYSKLLPLAHGSRQLLKESYELHAQSIGNSIIMSLPLNTQGVQARQALWRGFQSSINQLHQDIKPSVSLYLPDPKEYNTSTASTLDSAKALPLMPYTLLPENWLLPSQQQTLVENPEAEDGSVQSYDLALGWSSDEDSASQNEPVNSGDDSFQKALPGAGVGCKRVARNSESGNSSKKPRLKRSLIERICSSNEYLEKDTAYRLVAQHQAIFNSLIKQSPELQAYIKARRHQQVGSELMLEPVIDQHGEFRILSYQQDHIHVSDPIPNLPQAAKDHIRHFNDRLTEVHQALWSGKSFNLSHFWLAYATAHYAQNGIRTDIRSLLNATVFFPSLLLEGTQLPAKLIHQLKTSDILEHHVGLTRIDRKVEYLLQNNTSRVHSFSKALSRFGTGVMLYNLVDDFLKMPDFSSATGEQKNLWGLNTATDSVFTLEAVSGTLEELSLLALPGAEILGPLGLGLFVVTEVIELAYKERHLHQKLKSENHWLQVERDSFLNGPCIETQHQQADILNCANSTPIKALTLNAGKVEWRYGDLRLSKTVLNGYSQDAGSEPLGDQAWNHSLDIIKIFKKMYQSTKYQATQAQIVMLPTMPNKQVYYHYQDQGITLDNIALTFTPLIGSNNLERVQNRCYGGTHWPGTPLQKARKQLQISQDPEQLAFCLELLTHHRFCPEVLQTWFGSPACQVGYMKYDATSDMRVAMDYHYQYQLTNIAITLNDDRSYILVTPRLTTPKGVPILKSNDLTKNDRAYKVSYLIQGNEQKNTLYVQPGFHYQITSKSEQAFWAIVIPSKTQLIQVERSKLQGHSSCTRRFVLKALERQEPESAESPSLANLCIQNSLKVNIYSIH